MEDRPRLGQRLAGLRKARGLSLRQVGAETGVDDSGLSKIELGITKQPNQEDLTKLANFYDVEPEELWTLADYKIRSTELPGYAPYLRSKFGEDLPPEAVEELRNHFEYIKQKYKASEKQG